jgi:sulfite exporter TauE/SafE
MKWCIVLQRSTPLEILEGHELRPFVILLKKMGRPLLFDIVGAGVAILGLVMDSSAVLVGGKKIARWLPLLLAAGLLLLSVLAAVESVECSDRWPKP